VIRGTAMNFFLNLKIFGTPIIEYLFEKHLSETLVITTLIISLFTTILKSVRNWIRNRRLPIGLREKLLEAAKFYVKPDYVTRDPDHYLEPGQVEGPRRSIIKRLGKAFLPGSKEKRFVLLAGSGMGKTAILLNIYNRYLKTFFPKYKVSFIELGNKDSIQEIGLIENPENTVLLLDALDENSEAIDNHTKAIEVVQENINMEKLA
jgi:hypothetical protein